MPEDRRNAQAARIRELESENAELRERLRQVERERTEYLQNVSHQLVAPINAIKWHIENLTAGRMGVERARKVMKSISSQGALLVHLANNFNLMSNLDADHELAALEESPSQVDLYTLLVNLANDYQPIAWSKDIQIVVDEHKLDEAPPVLAVKPLIIQVFSNMIENAVKYSNDETSIKIGGSFERDSGFVTVDVSNQGISLKQEDETEVFARGFRSPEAKRKHPAGTGFGLYIARRIVEIHGGKISAHGSSGWTTFRVVLSVSGSKPAR